MLPPLYSEDDTQVLTVRAAMKVVRVNSCLQSAASMLNNNGSYHNPTSLFILYITILFLVTHQCSHASFSFS